jgi:hypothetical protein
MKKHNLNLTGEKYSEEELEYTINLFEVNDFNKISMYQKLSEQFIEKYSDKVYWNYISTYQNLSEEFIEKYSDKLIWLYISKYQVLSENFIRKHIGQIDINWLMYNKNISEEFKNKIKKEISLLKEII